MRLNYLAFECEFFLSFFSVPITMSKNSIRSIVEPVIIITEWNQELTKIYVDRPRGACPKFGHPG